MAKFTLNLDGPLINTPKGVSDAPFDYVSRNQLLSEIIKRYYANTPNEEVKVIDVGGLGSLLPQLTKTDVTIFDTEVRVDSKSKQKGDGARMSQIADGAYDVAVSSDTLEHIPPKDRPSFVNELIRVSSDLVILCAPFADHGAAEEEAQAQEFYKKLVGEPHRWLKEHQTLGLSYEVDILKIFNKHKDLSTVVINHNSIDLWRTLLSVNLLAEKIVNPDVRNWSTQINTYYNKKLMFKDFSTRSYRTFFVASKKNTIEFEQPTVKPSSDDSIGLMKMLTSFYLTVLTNYYELPNVGVLAKSFREFQRKTKQLDEEHKVLNEKYQHVITSKSWKYTRPIRGIRKKIVKPE